MFFGKGDSHKRRDSHLIPAPAELTICATFGNVTVTFFVTVTFRGMLIYLAKEKDQVTVTKSVTVTIPKKTEPPRGFSRDFKGAKKSR